VSREGQVWRTTWPRNDRTFLVLRTFVDDDGFIRHETLQLDADETTTSIESEWQSTGANSWEQLITFARLA
jgi:hypothetical protein